MIHRSLVIEEYGLTLPYLELEPWLKGNFSSHSVVIRIQSNFSKVGVAKLLAHVYFLLDICSSLKFRPSMTALHRNDHLGL
jgi:hypothetical protein